MSAKKSNEKENLKEEIIKEIQPLLQSSFSELKKDLISDIKEEIAKRHMPQKEASGVPDSLTNLLTKISKEDTGGIDIQNLIKAIPPPPPPSIDMNKEEYLSFQRENRMHQLIMTALPLLLQSQGGGMGGQVFQELLMRNMMDSMLDSTIQRKVLTQAITKKLGQDIPKDLGLAGNSIRQAADQQSKQAVNNEGQNNG